MAKLLAQGATMLDLSCPACEAILFRLESGKVICPNCNAEIQVMKKDEELSEEMEEYLRDQDRLLEEKAQGKISEEEFHQEITLLRKRSTKEKKSLSRTKEKREKKPETISQEERRPLASLKSAQRRISIEPEETIIQDIQDNLYSLIFQTFDDLEHENQYENRGILLEHLERLFRLIQQSRDL